MQYNAMDDAMTMRIIRKKLDTLIGKAPTKELLMIVIHLINPAYVRPILINLRDSLAGMPDVELDSLIADLTD